ncbi:MAG: PRC-barrel domain-containing protein, partial [Chthoniobacterales bacterium]|nr:PRC-barrel domain-containing protein [Chthoniobacterales bacterium]
MIRARELIGRAVVDMDAAEKLGNVKEIIVSQSGERVAGFVVARGESIFGGGVHRNVPASAVHVIGPDAITVSTTGETEAAAELASLPRVSDVMGRKMVSRSGRLLGSITDVLIEPRDGTIIGFSVGEGAKSKLENLFGGEKGSSTSSYVRADAD